MEDEYRQYLDDLAEGVLEFPELYGFEHDCHCAEDYENDNVGLVSECYTELLNQALMQCYKQKGELAEKERELANLRMQITESGDVPRV